MFDRYSTLLEGNKGPRVVRVGATYEVHPKTLRIIRGHLEVVPERPVHVVPFLVKSNPGNLRVLSNQVQVSRLFLECNGLEAMVGHTATLGLLPDAH